MVVCAYNPGIWRLRPEDLEFEAILAYIVRTCLTKINKIAGPGGSHL
jgi:hypothetical protein